MAITVVQTTPVTDVGSSGGTYTGTFPAPVTAGNTLVLSIGIYGTSPSYGSVKIGSNSDNWTLGADFSRNNGSTYVLPRVYYDYDCAGGATAVTCPLTYSFGNGSGYAIEVAGLTSTVNIDVTDGTSGGTGTSSWETGGGRNTTGSTDFLMYAVASGGTASVPSSGYWSSQPESDGFGSWVGGYYISSGVVDMYATGANTTSTIWAACALALTSGSSGPVTITGGDSFTGTDAVVAQIMSASDASNATVDATSGIILKASDSGTGGDSPAVTAHVSASDSSNGSAIDLPVRLTTSDTDSFGGLDAGIAGPKDTDSGTGTDAVTGVTVTLSDTDASNPAVDIGNPAHATLVSSDQSNAAVDSGSVNGLLVVDTDAFNATVDAVVGIAATLVTSDSGSGFDIGARDPVTDTDSFSGADAVVAYGVILSDTDTGHGVDAGAFGNVISDTDASSPASEASTLIVRDADTVQGADSSGIPPAHLSDSDAATGTDAGFVNFDGHERLSVSASFAWVTLERVFLSATFSEMEEENGQGIEMENGLGLSDELVINTGPDMGWVDLFRKHTSAAIGWSMIQRRMNAQQATWRTLYRLTANNTPLLVDWRDLKRVSKIATTEWDIHARTSAMADMGWDLRFRQYGPSCSAAWNIASLYPERKDQTTSLGWDAYKRISKVATIEWDTGGNPVPCSVTARMQWRVSERTSAMATTRWRVLGAVSQTATTKWDTLYPVTKTATTEWDTLGGTTQVSKTATLGWKDYGRSSTSCSVEWDATTRFKVSRMLGWAVLQRKDKAHTLGWDTYGRVFMSAGTELDEENGLGLFEENGGDLDLEGDNGGPILGWNTVTRTHKPAVSLGWNTIGRNTHARCVTVWNTIGHTHKSATTEWNTHKKITQNATTEWDTRKRVTEDTSAIKWNTLQRKHDLPVLGWKTVQRTHASTCAIEWNTRQTIFVAPGDGLELFGLDAGQSAILTWDTRQRITKTATIDWKITPRVVATAALGWNTITRRRSIFLVEWQTLESVSETATIEWSIGAYDQGLVMNAPSAAWQSAYPSR